MIPILTNIQCWNLCWIHNISLRLVFWHLWFRLVGLIYPIISYCYNNSWHWLKRFTWRQYFTCLLYFVRSITRRCNLIPIILRLILTNSNSVTGNIYMVRSSKPLLEMLRSLPVKKLILVCMWIVIMMVIRRQGIHDMDLWCWWILFLFISIKIIKKTLRRLYLEMSLCQCKLEWINFVDQGKIWVWWEWIFIVLCTYTTTIYPLSIIIRVQTILWRRKLMPFDIMRW